MSVGRGGADTGRPRGIGEGESRRAFFGDQAERRLQQRLLQIAVMIAALGAALVPFASSCKGFFMSRPERSLVLGPLTGVHQD